MRDQAVKPSPNAVTKLDLATTGALNRPLKTLATLTLAAVVSLSSTFNVNAQSPTDLEPNSANQVDSKNSPSTKVTASPGVLSREDISVELINKTESILADNSKLIKDSISETSLLHGFRDLMEKDIGSLFNDPNTESSPAYAFVEFTPEGGIYLKLMQNELDPTTGLPNGKDSIVTLKINPDLSVSKGEQTSNQYGGIVFTDRGDINFFNLENKKEGSTYTIQVPETGLTEFTLDYHFVGRVAQTAEGRDFQFEGGRIDTFDLKDFYTRSQGEKNLEVSIDGTTLSFLGGKLNLDISNINNLKISDNISIATNKNPAEIVKAIEASMQTEYDRDQKGNSNPDTRPPWELD